MVPLGSPWAIGVPRRSRVKARTTATINGKAAAAWGSRCRPRPPEPEEVVSGHGEAGRLRGWSPCPLHQAPSHRQPLGLHQLLHHPFARGTSPLS